MLTRCSYISYIYVIT